jgi:hypothetical protein
MPPACRDRFLRLSLIEFGSLALLMYTIRAGSGSALEKSNFKIKLGIVFRGVFRSTSANMNGYSYSRKLRRVLSE